MTSVSERVIQLLMREYLFQGLNPSQVAWIASRFERVTYERETVLITEGEQPDCFFIVIEGNVRITRQIRQGEHLLNILGPGDYFGEQELIYNRPRVATATTVDRAVLLKMGAEQFFQLLQEFPQMRLNLSATAESRYLARRIHTDWLGTDEVIYFLTRKHDLFLYLGLIWPVILGVGSLPVFAFALTQVSTPFILDASLVLGVLMLAASVVWGVWNWVDWGNDYYIVTSQRVIWLEKVVGLYESRREAPLDTVLAVNVISSQMGRWLNYGNVNVRTFTGGILMRNAARPYLFASFVEGYKQRVIQMSKDEDARAREKALAQSLRRSMEELQDHEVPAPQSVPAATQAAPPGTQPRRYDAAPLSLQEAFQTFLKVRYERNGVITYRKHWFILLRKAWLPALGLFGLFGVSLLLLYLRFSQGVVFLPAILEITLILLSGMVLLGWLIYDFWDWSNDIYRLTPEQILDIERKPLGQEIKRTASLNSILSIEHERENLVGILLNFGTVVVNVGETKFVFLGVYNPDQVHSDIADHREALNRRKRSQELLRERDQMVNWLVSFHNESKKIEQELGENQEDGEDFSR